MKKLENKNIIVTAAGQGIGRSTAIKFAKEGAYVIATDINQETLNSLNKEELLQFLLTYWANHLVCIISIYLDINNNRT